MTRETFYFIMDQDKSGSLYRKLYQENPKVFESPIRSWKEFCDRWEETGEVGAVVPPIEPPTQIAGELTEGEYFANEIWQDVNVIVNARYCPAFLHVLEFIKIVYVFRGHCSFFMEGQRLEMEAGNACIVAPGVEQGVFSCHDEDIVLNLLMRRSTFASIFSELLEVGSGEIIADFFWRLLYGKPGGRVLFFHGKSMDIIEESVLALYEEVYQQKVKSALIKNSLMLTIVAYLFRWGEQNAVNLSGKQKHYPLADYLQYMKRHLDEVTLVKLAERYHVSEGYLSRYFKKETGTTFSRLLRDMRLRRAAELLIKTECSMGKIVSLVGYTDQSIFYRNFKTMYGMTPMTYRKRKRQLGLIHGV